MPDLPAEKQEVVDHYNSFLAVGETFSDLSSADLPAEGQESSTSDTSPPNFYTQLCKAAELGDTEQTQWFLDRGVGPDKPAFWWTPALLCAAAGGQEESVRILLEAGADASACDDFGFTPLMSVARDMFGRWIAIVELLLQYGANVMATDDWDQTALDYALEASNEECAALLRQAVATKDSGTE